MSYPIYVAMMAKVVTAAMLATMVTLVVCDGSCSYIGDGGNHYGSSSNNDSSDDGGVNNDGSGGTEMRKETAWWSWCLQQ